LATQTSEALQSSSPSQEVWDCSVDSPEQPQTAPRRKPLTASNFQQNKLRACKRNLTVTSPVTALCALRAVRSLHQACQMGESISRGDTRCLAQISRLRALLVNLLRALCFTRSSERSVQGASLRACATGTCAGGGCGCLAGLVE
jgi:hypothetical protein